MEISDYQIIYYKTEKGENPYKAWLDQLKDKTGKAIILRRIERVRNGNLGNCKAVGEGVYELKIKFGPGYRVYFAQVGFKIIILLCGGDKSTQSKDIKKAKAYLEGCRIRYDQKKGKKNDLR
jgi:putative addiction module killer protein